jgi:4-diphosphocytidyl-2-C-methyl-D-erythritol kinase
MNRLQEPAERICSWIGRLRAAFDRLDLLGHGMSGSGSSYYGLCRGPRHARRVAQILRASRIGWTMPVTSLGPRLANARLS